MPIAYSTSTPNDLPELETSLSPIIWKSKVNWMLWSSASHHIGRKCPENSISHPFAPSIWDTLWIAIPSINQNRETDLILRWYRFWESTEEFQYDRLPLTECAKSYTFIGTTWTAFIDTAGAVEVLNGVQLLVPEVQYRQGRFINRQYNAQSL